MQDDREPGAPGVEDREDLSLAVALLVGSRAWMTIGSPTSLGNLDLGFEGAALLGRGVRVAAVVVDPGLADRAHLLVAGELVRSRPPRRR